MKSDCFIVICAPCNSTIMQAMHTYTLNANEEKIVYFLTDTHYQWIQPSFYQEYAVNSAHKK